MDLLKDNLDDGIKLAFNLLFDAEYKRNSMFFIQLSQTKQILQSGRITQRSMQEKSSIWQGQIKKFQENNNGLRLITSINLECSAHGVFNKLKLANTFLDFLQQIFQYKGDFMQVKKLKLKISGFNLNQSEDLCDFRRKNGQNVFSNEEFEFSFVHRLKKIIQMGRDNLESLQLRLNNMRYCKKEDLRDVLGLGFYESKKNQTGNKLTNLSLEMSDWMFYNITHKEQKSEIQNMNETSHKINPYKTQKVYQKDWLTSEEFEKIILNSIIQEGSKKQDKRLIKMPAIKRLRLQLSTLCYEKEAFKKFMETIKPDHYKEESGKPKYQLKNKKVTQAVHYIHYLIRQFIKDIVTVVMPKLASLELDFRNWSNDFQMKALKDELVNINRRHQLQLIEKQENLMKSSQLGSPKKLHHKSQNGLQQLLLFLVKTAKNAKIEEQQDTPLTIIAVV